MTVAITVALFAPLLLALVALFPSRRPPFSNYSFLVGFAPGELAGQLLVVTCGLGAALLGIGWPAGLLGALAAIAALGATSTCVALLVVSLRARSLVHRVLVASGVLAEAGSGRDRWLRWWRTCLAVPFGPRSARVHRDIAYVDDGDRAHLLDVYAPRQRVSGAPVLVFVHGGAWTIGSKRGQGLPMLHELVARGWVCISCNYRLSPRATWPDHLVDVKRVLVWAKDHAGEFGGDTTKFLAVAGNSAGGQLAALSALTFDDAAFQPGFEGADTRVDACVSLYGVLDMTGDPKHAGAQGRALLALLEHAVIKAPRGPAYEAASPLHRLREDAPPFIVLHGTHDSLVAVETARSFVAQFRLVTTAPMVYVEFPLAQHLFDLLCSPRTSAAVSGVATFLDALVVAKPSSGRATRRPPVRR